MSTYTPIASFTVGTAVSTISIGGLPQTYTDLVVVANIKGDTGSVGCNLQFNNDTSSNYSTTIIEGSGTGLVSTAGYANATSIYMTSNYTGGTNDWATLIWNIQNYSSTLINKSVLNRYARATGQVLTGPGLWRSTAAINILTFTPIANSFAVGSTFNIYGISTADIAGSPKATGGDGLITDGSYWYHTFTTSGTFTPLQALSVDYLVIGGGGGGGGAAATAAGGGAGGYRSATGQSVTAQAYTVTVGAGGAGGILSYGTNGGATSFNGMSSAGGGGGAGHSSNGQILQGSSGGSGGGSAQWNASGTQAGGVGNTPSTSPSQGNNGGTSSGAGVDRNGSGGGGAGAVGGNGSGNSGGSGGAGSNSFSTWATVTKTGVSGYYAGGGGGGGDSVSQRGGGAGGGGVGYYYDISTKNGGFATGSGGGGINQAQGGNGGGGIVIVRYAV